MTSRNITKLHFSANPIFQMQGVKRPYTKINLPGYVEQLTCVINILAVCLPGSSCLCVPNCLISVPQINTTSLHAYVIFCRLIYDHGCLDRIARDLILFRYILFLWKPINTFYDLEFWRKITSKKFSFLWRWPSRGFQNENRHGRCVEIIWMDLIYRLICEESRTKGSLTFPKGFLKRIMHM